MCGIIGGITKKRLPVEEINSALDCIFHRGPDDAGVYQDGNVFLGNRRLSIIDLSGGHQPVFNEDNTVVAVFNGEIYNYLELMPFLESKGHVLKTRSDTECLVHLWEEYGTGMCQELRGMFAFSIWDSRKREFFVARDRFGKKPLYYTLPKGGGVLFASEIKALNSLASRVDESWNISDQAIYHYLSLDFIPQPMTIFSEVFALLPGHWMSFRDHDLRFGKYWELTYESVPDIAYNYAMEQISALIADSVKLRLRSDVPVGLFLSGGIDSAVVALNAAKTIGSSLHTLTISIPGTTEDETVQAQRTAAFLGLRNTVIPIELNLEKDILGVVATFDQPFADSSAILTMRIAEHASQLVKVVLTGDGGDELFAGYRRNVAVHYARYFRYVPSSFFGVLGSFNLVPLKRRSNLGYFFRLLRCLRVQTGEQYLFLTSDMLIEEDKKGTWLRQSQQSTEIWLRTLISSNLSPLRQLMNTDIRAYLLSDLLVKMDMATMAFSIEARSPLLDHKLAEYLASLPESYLIHSFRAKAILRDIYRGKLPTDVIRGAKRGFELPLNFALKNSLKPLIMDTLGSTDSKTGEYLSKGFITDLLAEKVLQDRNWGFVVYSLLILELWLRGWK